MADVSQMRRWLKKWQKILRLQDYDIVVGIGIPETCEDMGKEDIAVFDLTSENKIVVDLNGEAREQWTEKLCVHELVHIILWNYGEAVEEGIKKLMKTKKNFDAFMASMVFLEDRVVQVLTNILYDMHKKRRR